MNGPAPILAKTAMPFDGFKGQLRQPYSDMPAYSEIVMSDKQIADIYAFLQTLPGPLPVVFHTQPPGAPATSVVPSRSTE